MFIWYHAVVRGTIPIYLCSKQSVVSVYGGSIGTMEEDIYKQVQTVDGIHETLTGYTGKRLRIRANMGRSKVVVREGTLTQIHNSLFIVETEEKRGRRSRQSYQYVDVLTGTVELTDLATEEPLFPELQEEPVL